MKYKEGVDMNQFEHIPQISKYNNNYYNGLDSDLLFCKSDDSGLSEWSLLVNGTFVYIGYSLYSEGDILHTEKYT